MERSDVTTTGRLGRARPRVSHTSAEAVAQQLRHEILRGALPPGSRLRQHEIAQAFGVSTTPVREAFAALEAGGLVEIDRYRGVLVFRPTAKDLRDSYEVRQVLETLAIAKAIPRLTPELVDELEALAATMRDTTDVERWMALNDDFHLRLYNAGDNDRLTSAIADQHASLSMYIYMHMTQDGERAAMDRQHGELLEACRDKDVVRAQDVTRLHLQASVAGMLGLLEAADGRAEPSPS